MSTAVPPGQGPNASATAPGGARPAVPAIARPARPRRPLAWLSVALLVIVPLGLTVAALVYKARSYLAEREQASRIAQEARAPVVEPREFVAPAAPPAPAPTTPSRPAAGAGGAVGPGVAPGLPGGSAQPVPPLSPVTSAPPLMSVPPIAVITPAGERQGPTTSAPGSLMPRTQTVERLDAPMSPAAPAIAAVSPGAGAPATAGRSIAAPSVPAAASAASAARSAGLAGSTVSIDQEVAEVMARLRSASSPVVEADRPLAAPAEAPTERQTSITRALASTRLPAAQAYLSPSPSLLLRRSSVIQCALDTAIDVTLPGLTSCTTTTPVYSADGKVLLLERGSRIDGELSAGLRLGTDRVFVLWSRITTPQGVQIDVGSPAADPLGRTGAPGSVDNHWPTRIGAAFLLSLVQDAVAASHQSAQAGAVVFGGAQTGGQSIASKVLDSTLNIPPSFAKHHGDRLTILVARDLDFGSVYALR